MFENLIVRRRDRVRLEGSPLCRQLLLFASVLEKQQYSQVTIRRYLFAADRFGRWLAKHDVGITHVDDAIVARYIESLGRRRHSKRPRGRLPLTATAARTLVEVLRSEGVIASAMRVDPRDAWLVAFDHHLEHNAGLSLGTRRIYSRVAGALIRARFGHSAPEWASLTADDVTDFVQKEAAKLVPSGCRSPVTATRAFLRFLVGQGVVGAELVGAVPTIRQWKQAALPNVHKLHRCHVAAASSALSSGLPKSTWYGVSGFGTGFQGFRKELECVYRTGATPTWYGVSRVSAGFRTRGFQNSEVASAA